MGNLFISSVSPEADNDTCHCHKRCQILDLIVGIGPESVKGIDVLEKAIPNIDWRRGHSGQLLSEEDAERLNELWNNIINIFV